MKMKNQDKYMYDKLLQVMCNELDKVVDKNIFIDVKYKKNVIAISSFLEFLKAGATIETNLTEDSKVEFILKME